MSHSIATIFLVSAFGAALQEILHWYQLKNKLHYKSYQKVIKSWGYWIVTMLMIFGSGIAVTIWSIDEPEIKLKTQMLLGAAFPLIFKRAKEATQKVVLGGRSDGYFS